MSTSTQLRMICRLLIGLIYLALIGCGRDQRKSTNDEQQPETVLTSVISQVTSDTADPEVRRVIMDAFERVRKQQDAPEAWGDLAMLLLAHDYREAADGALSVAEQLSPSDAVWVYLRGKVKILEAADNQSVMMHLRKAVELAPDNATMRLQLADILLTEGKLSEAKSDYELALRGTGPQDSMVVARSHAGLGEIAVRRDDLQTARLHLEKSLEAVGTIRSTQTLLATICFQLGDEAVAAKHQAIAEGLPSLFEWPDPYYDKVKLLQRGMRARLDYASTLAAQGRIPESIKFAETTVAQYPDEIPPRLTLGQQLLRAGKYAEAATVFEATIQRWPDAFDAVYMLGVSYEGWGKPEVSVTHYARATELQPNLAYPYARWGECLFKTKDYAGAISAFGQAVRIAPNDAQSHARLGQIALLQQRYPAAVEHLQNALSLAPESQQIQELLAEATSATR